MTSPVTWRISRKVGTWLLVGLVAIGVGAAAFLGIAHATDKPSFCGSTCHEMSPYLSAWSQGPHRDASCLECHVEPGQTARLTHKFSALKEVVAHFRSDTSFPRMTPTEVPDSRCIRCHTTVTVLVPGFSHKTHATRGTCASCHQTAGHAVPASTLQQAGILNPTAISAAASAGTSLAVIDAGAADLAGHITVVCSRCHTMSKTACSTCHTPQHKPRGECTTCHRTGPKFVFTHPLSGVDCASCHNRPAVHPASTQCTSCHEQVAKTWMHSHTSGSDCSTCHVRPAKHTSIRGDCATCHKQPGKSWAFSHPGIGANCASCHPRPAGMAAGACSTCHRKPGVSWAFSHPGIGANCASCHARPAGMAAGQCSTCHRKPGVSWAFTHPGSRANCTSCHARPAGMAAGQCSNCHHNTGVSWAFSHAPIRGGQHSSKSFACTNCHPNGFTTHTCIACHDSSNGG